MSTVLRPAGPLPPRVYWVRRGFILLGVLILILVIAESCGGGGGSPSATGNNPNPINSQTPATPQPCTPTDVELTLKADQANYAIGEQPKFTGTFTNNGTAACTVTESQATENWTVTSGPTTIWTTKGCTRPQLAKSKTLQPAGSKSVSITWDGKQYDSSCKPTADLQNGQYLLKANLDGFAAKSGVVFDMSASAGG